MTARVTPLAGSLLTVIAWSLSLAVLTARVELLFVALPLALTGKRSPGLHLPVR